MWIKPRGTHMSELSKMTNLFDIWKRDPKAKVFKLVDPKKVMLPCTEFSHRCDGGHDSPSDRPTQSAELKYHMLDWQDDREGSSCRSSAPALESESLDKPFFIIPMSSAFNFVENPFWAPLINSACCLSGLLILPIQLWNVLFACWTCVGVFLGLAYALSCTTAQLSKSLNGLSYGLVPFTLCPIAFISLS